MFWIPNWSWWWWDVCWRLRDVHGTCYGVLWIWGTYLQMHFQLGCRVGGPWPKTEWPHSIRKVPPVVLNYGPFYDCNAVVGNDRCFQTLCKTVLCSISKQKGKKGLHPLQLLEYNLLKYLAIKLKNFRDQLIRKSLYRSYNWGGLLITRALNCLQKI